MNESYTLLQYQHKRWSFRRMTRTAKPMLVHLHFIWWHTCKPFLTSQIRHCGTYHNDSMLYWN